MSRKKVEPTPVSSESRKELDAVVVGAGFGGLGMLYYLRQLDLSVRVYDAADGIGGTWHWNRYPGARTDSESYYYCFTFSEELLQEWSWSERYPGWEEVLRYLHYVADKLDLWPDIQLNTTITKAVFDKQAQRWLVDTKDGERLRCKYFISAMGFISEPYVPDLAGLERFKGPSFHTARWPREGLEYRGKRVGIIGAGATAVQIVPAVAEDVESVTLFQRTPNYIIPRRDRPMTPEWEREIKQNYSEILDKLRDHIFAMPFFGSPANRLAVETPDDERREIYEKWWQIGGFRFCFETFDDLLTDLEANETAAEFMRSKVRQIVQDPVTAERLTPKGYPLFAKRPPLDQGYYEAFNRGNVHLVDTMHDQPIEEITEKGVRTSKEEHEFDILVLATGFDALTGAMERLEICGANGETLKEKWRRGPATYMGVCTAGFPNMFMIIGPQSPFANLTTMAEEDIKWITECIRHMEGNGYEAGEVKPEAEEDWGRHCEEVLDATVMKHGGAANTWFLGANIPGKGPHVFVYFGGANNYINHLRDSVAAGFDQLHFVSEHKARERDARLGARSA